MDVPLSLQSADAIKLVVQQYNNELSLLAPVCSGTTVLIDAGLAKGI